MPVCAKIKIRRSSIVMFASISVLITLSEAMYDLVFANLAYSITGKTSSVTSTYAFGYVAEILIALAGSGFIDRFNKWKLFIATQCLNIVVFVAAIVTLSAHKHSVWLIWGFAFSIDLIHQYTRMIMFALVPFLFVREEISRVNGFLATLNGVARSVGPAVGALAILQVGLPMSLALSLSFLIAGVLMATPLSAFYKISSMKYCSEESSLKLRFQESFTGASRSAVMLLKSKKWRAFLGLYSSCVLVIGVLALLWITFLRDFHSFAPDETGYIYSIAAFGAILGGIVSRGFSKEHNIPSLIFTSHIVMFFGVVLAVGIKNNPFTVAFGMFLFQLGATFYFRSTATIIQLAVPKHVIGSWYGAIDFISRFAGLSGILVVGFAYDAVGAYWVYAAILALLMLSSFNWIPSRQVSFMEKMQANH